MATLTLEVDEVLLVRAEDEARRRGTDLKSELVAHVANIAKTSNAEKQAAAVKRMEELSAAYPGYLEGGMPNREERNAR